MDISHDLTITLLEVSSDKMCVKWQHFCRAEDNSKTKHDSVHVSINVKMLKSKRKFSIMIGTKKTVTIQKLLLYFLFPALDDRPMGHSIGIKREG